MTSPGRRHLALVGATASGKSQVAMAMARALGDVELVSMDSMQVYVGMDIGTAKPSAAERAEIPHHVLDVADPAEEWSVVRHQRAVADAVADIEARGRRALLVGGTGLYHQAVVDDLAVPGTFPEQRAALEAEPDTEALHRRLAEVDPPAAARMEPTNRRRVVRALEVALGSGRPFSSFGPGLQAFPPSRYDLVGLWVPRPVIDARIESRFEQMVAAGLVDEVRTLASRPAGLSRTARQALGYRELLSHVEGGASLGESLDIAVRRTRRFARRQEAWFRRDPRITWLGHSGRPEVVVPLLLAHWQSTMRTPCG